MKSPEECNKKYIEAASQIWCHDAVSHIEMIPELAMLVTLTIKKWHEQGYDEGRKAGLERAAEENNFMRYLITQVLNSLPNNRDWLDPDIEKGMNAIRRDGE